MADICKFSADFCLIFTSLKSMSTFTFWWKFGFFVFEYMKETCQKAQNCRKIGI